MYRIFDYKQTDFYHGYNREDEFYTTEKNLRKPEIKRKRKWPSRPEFWALEQPRPFRVIASEQAEWRKFKRWLKKHLEKIEATPDFDYDKAALDLHEPDLDICLGDWDEKGVVNHEMAIYKWDSTYFLSEKEIAALPEERRQPLKVPPKSFDLAKAERIVVNKADLKVQELQAE